MGTALTSLTRAVPATAEAFVTDDFEEIIQKHQRRVYRVVFLLVKDQDVADTLTQECFLKAYQKRRDFRGECSMATWLLRIAVNLARDHGKNRRAAFWKKLMGREQTVGGETKLASLRAPDASPERVLLAREELQAVWRALEAVSPQQRSVFLLRYAEEMSLEEVAEVLGLKLGTVKAHLFRATTQLRKVLQEKQWKSFAI
jgi:RNA polymerase sigma-70 factor, ECF subfamily